MKIPASEQEGVDEMTRRYREASAADPARPARSVRAASIEQARLEAAALKAAGLRSDRGGVSGNERQWRLRAVAGLAVVAVGVAVTLQVLHQPRSGLFTAGSLLPAKPARPAAEVADAGAAAEQSVRAGAESGAEAGAESGAEQARARQLSEPQQKEQQQSIQTLSAQARGVPPPVAQPPVAQLPATQPAVVSKALESTAADSAASGTMAPDMAGSASAAPGATSSAVISAFTNATAGAAAAEGAVRTPPPSATVVFASDSDEPAEQAQATLHDVLSYLSAHSSARAAVRGSYAGGGDATADDLARRRVAVVRSLLVAQGVAGERIEVTMSGGGQDKVEVRVTD